MHDNFGFKHKSGIFMAVSSLPSDYGIGSFGKEAFAFIDFLKKTGQKVWQVLPLNPTAYGDSPYQSPASLAGNPYFIDLEILLSKGLITEEELNFSRHDTERIDYGWLFENRYKILRAAYSRFKKDGLYVDFLNKNSYWLEDYALFMALKEVNNYCQWSSWAEDQKDYKKAISQKAKYEDKMDFWRFLQFEFFTQWQAVLDYAHQNGVVIVGDMPIYVAYDSVDVWSDTQAFLLDENFNPTLVAGCPPDGFSIDGQLWGNPIYNWEKMEQDGFKWWVKRTSHSLKMYDILRIDHFRGFAGYYCVKFGEPTARNGWWQPCVGKALFKVIREKVPALKVIAEDLGLITPDVVELLKETGYPGMKPLQFAFYDDDSEFLPREYTTDNCVVYTGTHDSDATVTWAENVEGAARERFLKECPIKDGQAPVDALILFAHRSRANLSMVPMIDYMHLDNSARMNCPGFAEGNWAWQAKKGYLSDALISRVYTLTKDGGRL